jgi:hypothetical protein
MGTANGLRSEGEKEPVYNSGVDARAATSDGAGEREMSQCDKYFYRAGTGSDAIRRSRCV